MLELWRSAVLLLRDIGLTGARLKLVRLQLVQEINSLTSDAIPISTDQKLLFDQALKKVPTGGNCKPFSWKWTQKSLLVEYDPRAAAHYLNRKSYSSYIALGCLIGSVELVAESLWLESIVEVDEESLRTEIWLRPTTFANQGRTVHQLTSRSTYRGPFASSEPLPEKFILGKGVYVRHAGDVSQQLQSYLVHASQFLWCQPEATRDFFKEIRFFTSIRSEEERGIASFELGISLLDQVSLFLLSRVPRFTTFLARYSPLRWIFEGQSKKDVKNSHFVCFTCEKIDLESLLMVGARALYVWIDIEKMGYRVQPFSFATLPALDIMSDSLEDAKEINPRHRDLFRGHSVAIIKKEFDCADSEIPVWLFRFGRPASSRKA